MVNPTEALKKALAQNKKRDTKPSKRVRAVSQKPAPEPKKPNLRRKYAEFVNELSAFRQMMKALFGDEITIKFQPMVITHSAGGWGTDGRYSDGAAPKTDAALLNLIESGKRDFDLVCVIERDIYKQSVTIVGGRDEKNRIEYQDEKIELRFEEVVKNGGKGKIKFVAASIEDIKDQYLGELSQNLESKKSGGDWHVRRIDRMREFGEKYYAYLADQNKKHGEAIKAEKAAFMAAFPAPK